MNPIPALEQPADIAARHPQYGAKRKVKARPKIDRGAPFDRRAELRVKIKSLAEEAKIIRREEQRTNSLQLYMKLHAHRLELRVASRVAQLALAYLKGKPYRKVEPLAKPDANLMLAVHNDAFRFGPKPGVEIPSVKAWFELSPEETPADQREAG